MGRKIGFTVLLLVVGLLVAAIALRKEPPQVPRDADHLSGWGDWLRCLECHDSQGKNPRPATHPNGATCSKCHGLKNE